MPDALYFTDDLKACKLLADDPFALLVGFAIDQQVPVQKAFAGPLVLKQRVGTLDPKKLAKLDLERGVPREARRSTASRARWPARVRDLAAVVADEYGGNAARIWDEAKDADDLRKRIGALPGFGPMKVTALGSVLAKRFDVRSRSRSSRSTRRSATSTRRRRSTTTRPRSAPTRPRCAPRGDR